MLLWENFGFRDFTRLYEFKGLTLADNLMEMVSQYFQSSIIDNSIVCVKL